jgi:hypothetical protein
MFKKIMLSCLEIIPIRSPLEKTGSGSVFALKGQSHEKVCEIMT